MTEARNGTSESSSVAVPPSPEMPKPGALRVLAANTRLVANAGRGSLMTVGVIQIATALLGGALLWSAGRVIDGLSGENADWSATWPWIVALAAITTVSGVLTAAGTEYQRLITELVQMHTSQNLIDASASVPFERFDNDGFYNRMQRALEGSADSATVLVWATLGATRSLIEAFVILLLLVTVVPLVIPIAIAAFIPLFVMSRRSNRVQHRFTWTLTEDDRHRGYLASLFADRPAAREVRMFDLGRWFGRTHNDLWKQRLEHLRRVVRTRIGNATIGSFVSSVTSAGALGLIAWMAARGDLSLADAGIGILGAHRLAGAATRINTNIANLHLGALQMRDYEQFLAEAAMAGTDDVGDDVPASVDEITLDRVSFRYPGASVDALSGIELSIRSGEVTAVVGTNGSGKSTLMLVLCGLYMPTEGRVLWDGIDVASFRPSSLRAAIAPMFQDFTRYQLTVRENILVSDLASPANDDRLDMAVDTANAAPVIDRAPLGMETRLSRAYADGTELSAGQWQRLAVARALFHGGPLLILDEPSADLDPLAERELVNELVARSQDRAVLFISHRFSAVRRADRIVVLNEGRLVEEGTHDDLLTDNGIYAAMYQAQVGDEVVQETAEQLPQTQ